jgi:zinc transporter, ZIP family
MDRRQCPSRPDVGKCDPVITGFLAFGLVALLYLVTKELLVEAREMPDTTLCRGNFLCRFCAAVAV